MGQGMNGRGEKWVDEWMVARGGMRGINRHMDKYKNVGMKLEDHCIIVPDTCAHTQDVPDQESPHE
jgi:hypothetical protein